MSAEWGNRQLFAISTSKGRDMSMSVCCSAFTGVLDTSGGKILISAALKIGWGCNWVFTTLI